MAGKEIRIRIGEGFFWIALGIFVCALSWRTGFGLFREPGPGFVAFAAGLCMAGLGVLMIGASLAEGGTGRGVREPGVGLATVAWIRIIYVTALLIAYAALMDSLGFILTTFLVLWALLFDWGKRNWFGSLVVAGVTAALSYLVFERLLGLPFPAGVLG
jgi:putative tricarboxylic transport membrane protein